MRLVVICRYRSERWTVQEKEGRAGSKSHVERSVEFVRGTGDGKYPGSRWGWEGVYGKATDALVCDLAFVLSDVVIDLQDRVVV